jgi:hypothetical protein
MSTHRKIKPSHRSQWIAAAAAAAALFAAAAIGITALRNNAAHAIHPVAAGAATPAQGTLAGVLPDAWLAPASDASVPSAHEVFKGRTAPDSDASAPTF